MPNFKHTETRLIRFVIATILSALLSSQVAATWSIDAVDTGEVGMAAATCNSSIQFIAAAVPGEGVVAAQAETSFKDRDVAIRSRRGSAKALEPGFLLNVLQQEVPETAIRCGQIELSPGRRVYRR